MPALNSKSSNAKAQLGNDVERHFIYFSELIKRPVCKGKIKDRLGKLTDLVFSLGEPYPKCVGLYIEHGWGKPTEFVPWENVIKIESDAIFVAPPDGDDQYPPFVDQPGWILLNEHLMGRTILDIDDRRIEVVNDVCLVKNLGKLLLVDVDLSFNGFLRRIGLGRFHWIKDHLVSWKYVQPLSVEDAVSKDQLSLSLTRKELLDLPSEDLADVLEELSGHEQQAVFTSLDSEKAAETLMETEPRAQRQIIGNLRREKARSVFSEMTAHQLAELFSVIPHDQVRHLLRLLPREKAERVSAILAEDETTARSILSEDFVAVSAGAQVGEVLSSIKNSSYEPGSLSYVYVTNEDNVLIGVVDLRELVLAPDDTKIGDIMIGPVVSAEENHERKDLAELFSKYHYRMIPVVDEHDHMLGTIQYNDIMKGLETR
ncbi:MAG: magnesium transporter MgtE N-terminal domain-containing protein [Desulfomonilaceae bacterium]